MFPCGLSSREYVKLLFCFPTASKHSEVCQPLVTDTDATRLRQRNPVWCSWPPAEPVPVMQFSMQLCALSVTRGSIIDHVTHLRRDLHWLWVPVIIHYRRAVRVFCCPHNMAPPYLARDLRWTDEAEALQRWCSGSRQRLIVPRTRRRTIGDCSFRVTAARHGTVFLLVSLQHLHWLRSNDNWKHSCLITLFREYIFLLCTVS